MGRGGSYLLNIGPDGQGRAPSQAAKYLRKAGDWIRRYPQVIYSAGPSPRLWLTRRLWRVFEEDLIDPAAT